MKTQLLVYIEDAIDKVLDEHCEEDLWGGLIHPGLTHQMARAAKMVFDAAMEAQEYYIEESEK